MTKRRRAFRLASLFTLLSLSAPALAQDGSAPRRRPGRYSDVARDEARSIDGSGNNPGDFEMGATGTWLRRLVAPDYADGISSPAGAELPDDVFHVRVERPHPRRSAPAHGR